MEKGWRTHSTSVVFKAWAGFKLETFRAVYYDGKTAVRHAVSVNFRSMALDVVTAVNAVVDTWQYDDIELSDQDGGSARVVKKGTEARLVFSDPQAFTALKELAPNLLSQKQRTLRNMGMSVVVTVVLIAIVYFSMPMFATAVVALIPFETEAKIGGSYVQSVQTALGSDEAGKCQNAPGRAALDEMVAYLSAYNSGPFPYHVTVLDNALVNALALPGGHIFIFRGLLKEAESSDEVAGVIAHEMSHVNHRHGMQGAVRNFGFSLLGDMMFGGNVLGTASNVFMMSSNSRQAEHQADLDAVETLNRADISTIGMAHFFERLKNKEQQSSSGLFALPTMISTHPPSKVREALARDVKVSSGGWTLSDSKWLALKAICGE